LGGVPFSFGKGALRLAATPVPQKAELRLPVGLQTSEVFLLMLARFVGQEEPTYGEGRFKAIRDVDC
jgi:hypothetical protein